MHVGVNLIYLVPNETGGTETVAAGLVPELVRCDPDVTFTAFINRETERVRDSLGWLDGVQTVTVPVKARNRVQWVLGEQWHLPRLAGGMGVDLVHSLANTAPLWGRFVRVTTIHDIHFKLVPEAHLGIMGFGMSVLVPLAARRSSAIITDARSTGLELQEHLGVPDFKVDAIPLAVEPPTATPSPASELRRRLGLGDRPIVLCVSAKRPHKNLARLISAVALIPVERRPVLVIPGYPTPHEEELRAHAQTLGVAEDVELLAWITPEDLEGLYQSASCLACPSLHEGFGLPVLEAMMRGLPVACSDRGALAEVAGDAAIFFDPLDSHSMAAAIERVLGHPSEADRLRRAGFERAAKFSWRRTAEQTLAIYRSVLQGGR